MASFRGRMKILFKKIAIIFYKHIQYIEMFHNPSLPRMDNRFYLQTILFSL